MNITYDSMKWIQDNNPYFTMNPFKLVITHTTEKTAKGSNWHYYINGREVKT